ncbi:uncharacterized protein TM35_002241000 [Trypanosoma theileri]|uniref:Uncharacterized protein n=1 Tax=Trypanosoma theileri TaxID=67003 RepID=A0A1X0NCX6_9TRYP|nr:uncharacterized protein TM35_002241000 [Trypanosoma theileri]ORC78924.1 hypothetical protein TM35_002241000 [Trypanosoma theileri]
MIPLKGYVSLGLELMVGEPDGNSSVDLFTMNIAGALNSSYPFRLERVSLSNKTVYIYNDTEMATIFSDDKCVLEKNTVKNDDIALWDVIRTILSLINKNISGTSMYYRGFEGVLISGTQVQLTIPKKFKGNGELQLYNASVFLVKPWNVNYAYVRNLPVKVDLVDAENNKWSFTFFDFAVSTVDTRILMFPSKCVESSVFAKEEDEVMKEATMNKEMPGFPEEFSAEIQVVLPSEKLTFTMHEQFSSLLHLSHSSVYGSLPDEVGRVNTYDWYIVGSYRMSYFYTKSTLPFGQDSPVSRNLREYFWPNTERCVRTLINYDAIAGSVGALMLYSSDVPPVYIGSQIVRGIPCNVWSASLSGVRVKWFWADRDKVNLNTDNSTDDMSVLMRIVVEGVDAAPFYVHHPFLAQGNAFPSKYRTRACRLLNPWDPACRSGNGYTKYIYDITSFSRYISAKDFVLPTSCTVEDVPSTVIPDVMCSSDGGIGRIFLTLALFVLGILIGCCIVWFRYGVIVHKLRGELLMLALENEKQRRSLQQQMTS